MSRPCATTLRSRSLETLAAQSTRATPVPIAPVAPVTTTVAPRNRSQAIAGSFSAVSTSSLSTSGRATALRLRGQDLLILHDLVQRPEDVVVRGLGDLHVVGRTGDHARP